MWIVSETKEGITRTTTVEAERLKLISENCITKFVSSPNSNLKLIFCLFTSTKHLNLDFFV